MPGFLKLTRRIALLPPFLLLAGCDMVVMAPSGDIAAQQRDLIVISTILMLLIIVPVIFLTLLFAWRYRRANTAATYDPEWHHSTALEVVIWSAPLAIIIALGAITWISTHKLDPYRPLDRIDAARPIPADVKPVTVEVVALDWKWLFFYPAQGIATVNEVAAPVDVPINFKITASSVMNSFYIPALAGQIYAMPGMQTKLHAVINKPGEYDGFSANYSGDGFSHMRFKFHGVDQEGFDAWVARVKSQGTALNRDAYLKLEKPSEREPVRYFATVEAGLYDAILNMCATPGKMCMHEMMHIDAMGGAGTESVENRDRLEYDNRHATEEGAPAATFPATGTPARSEEQPEGMDEPMQHETPGTGGHEGHSMPGMQEGSDPAPAQLRN
ncbi:cytochrome o ubiquinol oxidase subunit II (plasmid) [Sinorhizobium fredii NGR234]|uniref:Ubiquinol oxidase polypeptide II n=1 Tax=Sinorhizobium fredii (strain NBRC 101917 / NGR234) TaxID=394 RepID=C3KLP1_SINFN|nr:ubiquinol oxidase subunit II [Sinorhizobium fredii]ACP23327.1 cytochrome o ubiquinol oxidase subunit II [Sinorhizobium fredii NGR234]